MSNVKELLDAGVHFGHQTRKWNPKMKEYIFEARNGIHIIDLVQTATQIDGAADFQGRRGQGQQGAVCRYQETGPGQHQGNCRDDRSAVRLRTLAGWYDDQFEYHPQIDQADGRTRTMESDGRMAEFVKQEQSMLRRELNRLHIRLNGIRDLNSKPDAMFIVDIKREHNALAEARRLRVPVVAIVDTNTDPTLVDYPIAGNDDAIRSIKAVLGAVTQPMIEARAAYDATSEKLKEEVAKKAEAPAAAEEAAPAEPAVEKPAETVAEEAPAEAAPEAAAEPAEA